MLDWLFVQVTPLTSPSLTFLPSSVRNLSQHGKVVSPIRKILTGCKSLLLRCFVSHCRQLHIILNTRSDKFNYHFIVQLEDFDYALFAVASTLERFNYGKEGHLARACHNRPGLAASPLKSASTNHGYTGHPSSPAAHSGCEASVVQCSGGAACWDRVEMEPQVEEKQSEHESKTERSRMNENVEMVGDVEVRDETGDLGEMDKVTVGTGEVTGEMGEVNGEAGEQSEVTDEAMGEKGELGEKGVVTVELGEGGVEMSGWRSAPMKQRSKRKNMMKNVGGIKTGQLVNEVAAADTSDGESYVSDCSEVSHADI